MSRPIDIRDIPPRDAVLGDKRLGLDADDELSMTNEPDNSANGTAASRDTGTAEDQIPLNSDLPASAKTGDYNDLTNKPTLGTAADKNTGTAAGQIPLNSNLGNSSTKNTGTATGEVLLAEDAGLNSGALNLTSNNLNNNISDGIGSRIWAVNISGASIPVDTVVAGSGLRPAFANSSGAVIGGAPLTGTYRNVSNISLGVNETSTFVKVS